MVNKEDETRVTLRIPTKLYRAIKRIAKEEERSANSQIIFFLKRWLNNVEVS